MNFEYYLTFGVYKEYGSYNEKAGFKKLDYKKFLSTVKKSYLEFGQDGVKAAISARINNPDALGRTQLFNLFKKKRYIVYLDCDTQSDCTKSLNCLLALYPTLRRVVIESSPGKYWIVLDKILNKRDFIEFVSVINGVDQKFVKFLRKTRHICIRAFPKNGFQPRVVDENFQVVSSTDDMLYISGRFSNNQTRHWVQSFVNYWKYSEPAKWMMETYLIDHPYLIANPNQPSITSIPTVIPTMYLGTSQPIIGANIVPILDSHYSPGIVMTPFSNSEIISEQNKKKSNFRKLRFEDDE